MSGRHPPGQTPPSGRYPQPRGSHPQVDTLLGRQAPRQTPPDTDIPSETATAADSTNPAGIHPYLIFTNIPSGGSRILPRGDALTPKSAIFFNFFAENCIKNKRIWTPSAHPPTDQHFLNFMQFLGNMAYLYVSTLLGVGAPPIGNPVSAPDENTKLATLAFLCVCEKPE